LEFRFLLNRVLTQQKFIPSSRKSAKARSKNHKQTTDHRSAVGRAAHSRRTAHYTNFVNLLDLCAIAVPSAFTTNGLPVGATLIAPAFCDQGVIVAGQTYMAAAEHQGRVVAAA
jgi:Asp-tRNA(Asn)/Glu-tRNA(Gln) amidotransferase A subunit family amidase